MLLGTYLLLKDSQQKRMDDHLVWFAATVVESKLSGVCNWHLICLSTCWCIRKTKGGSSGNHSFSWPKNMNDRLRTIKIVVEKVREFIFVILKKILRLENFSFHKQQAALRCVSVRNTFVAVDYNIRRRLY